MSSAHPGEVFVDSRAAEPERFSSVNGLLLLLTVFGVTFVAELPDKSLFASLVLGTRYRPAYVWLGVAAAFAVHVGLSVTAGGLLTLAPRSVVDFVSAALFLGGAVWMVWSGRKVDTVTRPCSRGTRRLKPERSVTAPVSPAPDARSQGLPVRR